MHVISVKSDDVNVHHPNLYGCKRLYSLYVLCQVDSCSLLVDLLVVRLITVLPWLFVICRITPNFFCTFNNMIMIKMLLRHSLNFLKKDVNFSNLLYLGTLYFLQLHLNYLCMFRK
jgi:hypothetical protein